MMAYFTGRVNTFADLLTAIRDACTGEGWTLSGNVLHKGNAYLSTTNPTDAIEYAGGTGIDGSNLLTGAAPGLVRTATIGNQTLTFPVVYEAHIFTDPDEVYFVFNYNVDFYQYLAFGISSVPGLSGTGFWFGASRTATGGNDSADRFNYIPNGPWSVNNAGGAGGAVGRPLFYADQVTTVNSQATFIHHGLDGRSWSTSSTSDLNQAWSFPALAPLIGNIPNNVNQETPLLPYPVFVPRSSGNKVSMIADLKNIRHCRITFHDPGDIITHGAEQWKLYPWYRKNSAVPDGGNGISHSGTGGFAIRYTGA